jgi:uncharacterized membrane protein YraQ (UPF0718 family)
MTHTFPASWIWGWNTFANERYEWKAEMNVALKILQEAWTLLLDASFYVLFGLLVSGMLRVFLSPNTVAQHLGKGKFRSVFKAAFLGIPVPLCSCGVLPAAVSLKRQGANNGATTAFLISTPESGVDSIAITYALLDPIMTVVRPVVAFVTAAAAGVTENLFGRHATGQTITPDLSCPVDACCDGLDCDPKIHSRHHSFSEKIRAGLSYAFGDVWDDIAAWFLVGLVLAGLITALVPEALFHRYLGSGISSMLIMLAVSAPLYICATASTPIAAALILKGVSPGAALVFLLAGPATNVTSLTVLLGVLGKRATAIYLGTLGLFTIASGLAVNHLYLSLGISPGATLGQAAELVPPWAEWAGALILLALSVGPVSRRITRRFASLEARRTPVRGLSPSPGENPTCAGSP